MTPEELAAQQAAEAEAEAAKGGNNSDLVSLDDPKIQAIIQGMVDTQVTTQVAEKTKGLVAKNTELLGEAKAAKSETREFKEKYGEDYGTLDKAIADEKARKEADMTDLQKLESTYSQEKETLTTMWAEQKAKLETQAAAKDAAINKYLIDGALETEINAAGGKSHFLKPVLAGKLQVFENEAGDYDVRVMEGANPKLNPDGSPMGIAGLVSAYKADEAWGAAFGPSGATGGGATGSNKANSESSGKTSGKRLTMTDQEKVTYIGEHGVAKYMALPE